MPLRAAARLKVDIARVDVSSADGIEPAFASIAKLGAGGVVVQFDFLLAAQKQRIMAFTTEQRLPTVYGSRMLALEGGLIFYGPDLRENFRRGATYVDSILKGHGPATCRSINQAGLSWYSTSRPPRRGCHDSTLDPAPC